MQWNPRLENILSTQAYYSAPVYSATCGSHFVWDQVISSPVVAKRGITRDGVTYVTEYSDFDEYGRARATAEYALGQKGFSGTQPVPASTRSTAWTYYAAPSLNIVGGHPLTKAVCLGSDCIETSWTYSERGARTSETISGVTTTFGYYVDGNLFSVTNALGQVLKINLYEYGTATDFDFNGAFGVTRTVSWEGRTLTETDGRGYTATHTYDDIGRPLTLVPPGPNNSTSYSYAPDNSWAREARGTYFRNTYLDALGRVIPTADLEGVLTTSRYDAMGWSWFTSYAHDTSIGEVGDRTERDGLGRPTIVTNAYRPVTASCDVPGACTVTFLRDAGCTATQVARALASPPSPPGGATGTTAIPKMAG